MIERHFTDSNDREGPDHKFAMNPENWAEMVQQVRTLERALGSTDKFVTGSELETYVLQRRCLRAARDIKAGETITADMVEPLRPAASRRHHALGVERSGWEGSPDRYALWDGFALGECGRLSAA